MKINYKTYSVIERINKNLARQGVERVIFYTNTEEKMKLLLKEINKISNNADNWENRNKEISEKFTSYGINTCVDYNFISRLASYADKNFYSTHKDYKHINIIEL